ncbi:hypothetical protein QE152_g4644 [Popillia japonica]|uniref:C2HC/C3H-type domain-containing protein n=1 Tax=Popillia japonica TaxID=7064 RepID=A0AAW1MTK9_POPJA
MASRLAQMQARFQQKQMQEKEEKLLKLYENQQQRTIERVSRGSAGSDGTITTTTTTTATNLTAIQGGKVRQMFDERRQKAGIDRSYPLEPLKQKSNNIAKSTPDKNRNIVTKTTVKSTVQKSLKTIKNGKPGINKREVIESTYTNENGNEHFEEQRHNYENEANDLIKQDNDLVNLMNNHNLGNNIDDEEMPNIGLDEVDEPIFIGKLSNVGGVLPSQVETNRKAEQKNSVLRPSRKPITSQLQQKKPTAQKPTSKPKQANSKGTPTGELKTSVQSNTSVKNTPVSPSKLNMSAKRPSNERVPSTNRPSARQTPRGPPSAATKDDLSTCKFCNRRFAPDRLQIHEDICARTGKKKRRTYDALKHRVQGTELEPFARKAIKVQQKISKPGSAKKSNWRQTHNEFISSIRAAKMAQAHLAKGGKLADLPPPPPSSNPDYVQCPHCGRRFNETAAARHIPKCATYEFNKSKGPVAKPGQKVASRTQYR